MANCVTLKNLEICKNTILYLIGIQIPGNKNLLNFKAKISRGVSPATTYFNQVEEPNLIMSDYKMVEVDLVDGADKFVIGYISKFIDIYVMNNYNKFITKNSQVPPMFRSILKNFYNLKGSEMLHYVVLDNQEFIENDNANLNVQRFGLGSYAALYDYQKFEDNKNSKPEFLYLYLTKQKNIIINILEERLIEQIKNKEIYKNDLYITTISEIFYFSNIYNKHSFH